MRRCGGAVVRPQKRQMDAKLANTRVKMMKKMRQLILMLKRKIKRTKKMSDVYAARKLATKPLTVQGNQI